MPDDDGEDATPFPKDSGPRGEEMAGNEVVGFWTRVMEQMAETAGEYRTRGWEVIEVHPGDVTPMSPEEDSSRWGLDVLVPDDELEQVRQAVEPDHAEFDEWEVFGTTAGGFVLLLLTIKDTSRDLVVFVPVYYRITDSVGIRTTARERGKIHTHLRPLTREPIITFTHDDPVLFFPSERGP